MDLPIRVGISPTLNIRGLLADRFIPKGTVIEECPIILSPVADDKLIDKTVLGKFYFEWNDDYDCFVLGYGALMNHSDTPNARFEYGYETKTMSFVAEEDIAKGQEITINYQQGTTQPMHPEHLDYNKNIIG